MKLFSVFAQNSDGDLFSFGAELVAGRSTAMTRENAWEMVKAIRAGFCGPVSQIKVCRGCSTVWSEKVSA